MQEADGGFPPGSTLVISGRAPNVEFSQLADWEVHGETEEQPRVDKAEADSGWAPLCVPVYATKGTQVSKPLCYYELANVFVQRGKGGFIDTKKNLSKLETAGITHVVCVRQEIERNFIK